MTAPLTDAVRVLQKSRDGDLRTLINLQCLVFEAGKKAKRVRLKVTQSSHSQRTVHAYGEITYSGAAPHAYLF